MDTSFKGKKIIITAGPTWVKIDSVRVISNTASGQTGTLLAERLSRLGARVTLLLGPVGKLSLSSKVKFLHFKLFEELYSLIKKELSSESYDFAIHSAAVSDYRLARIHRKKLDSGLKNLRLELKPTIKIINLFKKMQPQAKLVAFKFEPDTLKKQLELEAYRLIKSSGAKLIVANTTKNNGYAAYIVSPEKTLGPFLNKGYLAKNLIKLMKDLNA
ncbi:MAG: phosphopantothenoylcysteine decarboxylase [Candidatus Omnitrophica bacterium]|nr:phosphopantothenoylcysteine decarboxylase [Candidatus Omnitrophota bacterium]